eukprot:5286828-Prymnesium_polylepis.2
MTLHTRTQESETYFFPRSEARADCHTDFRTVRDSVGAESHIRGLNRCGALWTQEPPGCAPLHASDLRRRVHRQLESGTG